MNKKKIYYYSLGVIAIIVGIVILSKFVLAVAEGGFAGFETPQEYLNLFNSSTRNKLKSGALYTSKKRNKIATLKYDEDMYSLIVYKIPFTKNFSLNKVTINNTGHKSYSSGYAYIDIDMTYLNLHYKSGSQPPADQILLALEGQSQSIVSNDSIKLYYLKYNNLSIQYNGYEITDFYFKTYSSQKLSPLSVLFFKRGENLYLIIMSINAVDKEFDPKLLLSLLG